MIVVCCIVSCTLAAGSSGTVGGEASMFSSTADAILSACMFSLASHESSSSGVSSSW